MGPKPSLSLHYAEPTRNPRFGNVLILDQINQNIKKLRNFHRINTLKREATSSSILALAVLVRVVVVLLLLAAELLPVALEAVEAVLERVALLPLHARVQDQAAVLKNGVKLHQLGQKIPPRLRECHLKTPCCRAAGSEFTQVVNGNTSLECL